MIVAAAQLINEGGPGVKAAGNKALNGTDKAFEVSNSTGYEDIEKVEKGATDQDAKITFRKRYAEWKGLFSPLYPKSMSDSPPLELS